MLENIEIDLSFIGNTSFLKRQRMSYAAKTVLSHRKTFSTRAGVRYKVSDHKFDVKFPMKFD